VNVGKPDIMSNYQSHAIDGYNIHIHNSLRLQLKDKPIIIGTSGFLWFKSLSLQGISPYTA